MHQGRSAQISTRTRGFHSPVPDGHAELAPALDIAGEGGSHGHGSHWAPVTGHWPNPAVLARWEDVRSVLLQVVPVPLGGSAPHADLWPGR